MITPVGTGGIWLGAVHVCVCSASCMLVRLFPCMSVLACLHACVYLCVCILLARRAMPQGAWAAWEGPVCPQSLTICALLVVIKVSNLEVSWGLAKRGQKMSLRCSSRWAAVTIFTYLYTLIVFASLPWHWGSQSLARGGKKVIKEKVKRAEWRVTDSESKFSCRMDLNE